ncbi:hypothetical protein NAEGRDRAFT_81930 [Naegleria gruberi]|uniref:MIF4G domain-containing protein n=1 Tax=Naegleria gruberi TaxID=5762 RepID=D2W0H8_NAEGR|nr:uncharacterized protein NAEGRDRAFT_81930 [Naegleria gruberi]EFC37481.1 hypothetical protein NAEGRDRAFT_81930 [Naegleria gruberi]|eukprot:XP_002670225.1 hypothetical protein NAEGRDRAFT_81930 [Naegleria gruberi strain NEG-M]
MSEQQSSSSTSLSSPGDELIDQKIGYISFLMSRLVSCFDKSSTLPTAQNYESMRSALFKNFNQFDGSERMQSEWVDMIYSHAVERGLYNTMGNLMKEQLKENVGNLNENVIIALKKKLLTKCQIGFKEELVIDEGKDVKLQKFEYMRKRSNNIKFIAKLLSNDLISSKIGAIIIESLFKPPSPTNLKLLTMFVPLYENMEEKLVNLLISKINLIVKADDSNQVTDELRFDLMNLIDHTNPKKLNTLDRQLETLQLELPIISLNQQIIEWEALYAHDDEEFEQELLEKALEEDDQH